MARSLSRAAALAAAALSPSLALAQGRELQHYDRSEPEGRLMAFYSAAMTFSSLALAPPGAAGSVSFGVEAAYVPSLSLSQRSANFDKPEATNLAPVLPRPRIAVTLPLDLSIEASWIPPVKVFGIKANIVSAAVSRPITRIGSVDIVPRVAALTGSVKGAITCSAEAMEQRGAALAVYYANVCHGRDSDDHFQPRHLSGELILRRAMLGGALLPYVSGGVLRERTKFDIGVIRDDGSRDPDHPILQMDETRAFGSAGVTWLLARRLMTAGEVYYAPGSLLTVRLFAGLRLR